MTPTKSQKEWLEANPKYVQTENGVAYREIGAVSPDGHFMKIKMRHPIIFQREIDWMGVGVSNGQQNTEAT